MKRQKGIQRGGVQKVAAPEQAEWLWRRRQLLLRFKGP